MDVDPHDDWPVRAKAARLVTLAEVVDALEAAYHPQNPLAMHPADFIRKRYEMPGHEGLRYG